MSDHPPPPMGSNVTVDLLRQLFRSYLRWQHLFEEHGIDTITLEGVDWSWWDLRDWYRISQSGLSRRQSQAIEMFLVQDMSEAKVAKVMGIKPGNPVGMYATDGLRRLIKLCGVESGVAV